jgi:hypothetical protein
MSLDEVALEAREERTGRTWETVPGHGRIWIRGPVRQRPGWAAKLLVAVGAWLLVSALFQSDPVRIGLVMLLAGGIGMVGLRRLLVGSLDHETGFAPGSIVRVEQGSQTPRHERELVAEDLRCIGLVTVEAAALGRECRLYVVQKDRGLLAVARESGEAVELRALAAEVAGIVGVPLEQLQRWPTHEWPAAGVME